SLCSEKYFFCSLWVYLIPRTTCQIADCFSGGNRMSVDCRWRITDSSLPLSLQPHDTKRLIFLAYILLYSSRSGKNFNPHKEKVKKWQI
ncbi:MAG TPA: hypothetical protein DD440_03040, partial [Porticoccaceae bacterium]|nr:hypothetical protein [Porticoccaceae bacterium]